MAQAPPLPRRSRHKTAKIMTTKLLDSSHNNNDINNSKPTDFDRFRDFVEAAFECPICMERMVGPLADSRVLPCQHAYCHMCLTKLFYNFLADAASSSETPTSPLCPECRVPIGCTRVDQLPPNVQLNRLSSRFEELQKTKLEIKNTSLSATKTSSISDGNRRIQQQQQHQRRHCHLMSGDFCTAVHEFSYDPPDSRYLELRPGDLIEMLPNRHSGLADADSTGWAYGRVGSRKGYFPLAYTRPVVSLSSSSSATMANNADSDNTSCYPVVSALHNWRPSVSLAFGTRLATMPLLPLIKDRKYLVLDKQSKGWLHGRCQLTMATGLFPASYVTKAVQPTDLPSRSRLRQAAVQPPQQQAAASSSVSSNSLDEQLQVQHQPAASMSSESSHAHQSGVLVIDLNLRRRDRQTRVSSVRGFIKTLRSWFPGSNARQQQQQQQQQAEEDQRFADVVASLAQNQISPAPHRSPQFNLNQQQQQHAAVADSHPFTSSSVPIYRCIQSRQAATHAELTISYGELICVINQRLDGWCRGLSLTTQQVGLFPASCVRPSSL